MRRERRLFLTSVNINNLIICNIGHLYPAITSQIIKANSFEMLKESLAPYPVYYNMIRDVPDPKKIDDFSIQAGLKTLGRQIKIKI